MGSKVGYDNEHFLSAEAIEKINISKHAYVRMDRRGIPVEAIWAALEYGLPVHVRGADVYAIGSKQAALARGDGVNIDKYIGTHVVCDEEGGIITVYRNHDLRGLKPRRRHLTHKKRNQVERQAESLRELADRLTIFEDLWDDDDSKGSI